MKEPRGNPFGDTELGTSIGFALIILAVFVGLGSCQSLVNLSDAAKNLSEAARLRAKQEIVVVDKRKEAEE